MHNKFFMGVKFWRSWRNFQKFSKSQYYGDFFQKCSPTCDFLKNFQGIYYIKLEAIFLMGFLLKIEGDFSFFYVDFFCKIEGEFNILVNFFLVQFNFKWFSHTKPALVLLVLYFWRDFFWWRSLIRSWAVLMDESEVKWSESEVNEFLVL